MKQGPGGSSSAPSISISQQALLKGMIVDLNASSATILRRGGCLSKCDNYPLSWFGDCQYTFHFASCCIKRRNRLTYNHIRSGGRITVTKADIIDQISAGTGLTKLETEAVVNGFISVVKSELKRGGRIDLRGFGSFTVQHRAARTARNPRTNTPVHVPASDIPLFKASKEFRKEVDESVS